MKFNQTTLACALLCAMAGAAHADVQVYGIMDLAVTTTNHGNPSDPNSGSSVTPLPASAPTYNAATAPNGKTENRVTSLLNGGLSPSRLGFKGNEDLGGGLQAVFTLESGLNAAYGSIPNGRIADSYSQANTPYASQEGSYDGQFFARESTVGFKSATWGELRIGRQTTIMGDTLGQFDTSSGYMDPLVFNGGYGGGGFTAEARWDNSFKYTVQMGNSLKGQLMYRLGGTSNSFSTQSAGGAALHFSSGAFKLSGVYLTDNDAELAGGSTQTTATSVASNPTYTNTLKVTFGNTHATGLMAAYAPAAPWSVKGGWEQIHTANPSNPVYDQTMTSLSGVTVTQYSVTGFANPRVENMYWLTGSYQLSGTWKANAGYYQRNTNAYGAAGATTGTMSGTSKAKYYVLEVVDSLSKRTDVYGLFTTANVSGPVWAGYLNNTTSFAVGVRHMF